MKKKLLAILLSLTMLIVVPIASADDLAGGPESSGEYLTAGEDEGANVSQSTEALSSGEVVIEDGAADQLTEVPALSPAEITPAAEPDLTSGEELTDAAQSYSAELAGDSGDGTTVVVSDSVVTGLSGVIRFEPGVYKEFDVIGAGSGNEAPQEGDVKFEKDSWAIAGDGTEYSTDWKIGFEEGKNETGSFVLDIFMKKYVYTENAWVLQTDADEVPVLENFSYTVNYAPYASVYEAVAANSKVTGFYDEMIFAPGVYFDFDVIGDGSENDSPIEGDTKFEKISWVYGGKTFTSWRIGSPSGISTSADIPITIKMGKWEYKSGEWTKMILTDEKGNAVLDAEGNEQQVAESFTYNIKHQAYKRPAVTAAVTDSVVKGLEEALELRPGVFYNFEVFGGGYKGSGVEIGEPFVEGDTRWTPACWMQEGSTVRRTKWSIGTTTGANIETTLTIKIFFTKQVYDGSAWVGSGEEYITCAVKTKTYSEVTPTPTPVPTEKQFKDVTDPTLFYYDAVYWAAEQDITTGYSDNTFHPMEDCSRAAVVTFLWRMAGKPAPSKMASFTDMTSNEDFNSAISWALEQNITTGYSDNTFRPWATCSRAAIVTFIWRYAGKPKASKEAAFTDMTKNDEFNAAISWAAEKGITTGYSDGTFRPWSTCNRMSVVTFLYRAK